MNFKSDNVVPVHPQIMKAIVDANQGSQSSYGADDYSLQLKECLSKIFEKEVSVYLTSTGTAANSLALSALMKPYEVIFCSDEAHIAIDECGAPEFYTGGAKLISLKSAQGKINVNPLKAHIDLLLSLRPHAQKPNSISLTQGTECGTVYTISELEAIAVFSQQHHLSMHMDGARFANSLVTLNCKPADITWKVGVDVMSLGATKNGALCAEAIIFFNSRYAENFDYLHKRSGQLISKTRFFSSQFLAYFKNNLWLKNASHANEMAQELASVFTKYDIEVAYPVEINEVFVKLDPTYADYLRGKGVGFYPWGLSHLNLYRFVTSWCTVKSDIAKLDNCLAQYKGK